MPVASNPLLQSLSVAKIQAANAARSDKAADASASKASDFALVYAQQSQDKKLAQGRDTSASCTNGKVADGSTSADDEKIATEDASVAADGKNLQTDGVEQAATAPAAVTEPPVVDAGEAGALADAQWLQAASSTVSAGEPAAAAQTEEPLPPAFDPSTDPLADLPAVRLALEQSAQAQGKTSAHAASAPSNADQPEAAPGQVGANGLATLLDQQAKDSTDGEPGENTFSGLLDDGLKDLKSAASDTRIDNFAERLGTLTQAATAKTANAMPLPGPLNQPLAMQQGGWTEGLVNRVMYLSSQSLKSADIQLEPAELGRLDIRVNLAPDQQAHVAFSSGHAGVREALEGQVHRLRDMFAEQGLGGLDVSVFDQSRGQDQGREAQRGSASSQRGGDGGEALDPASPAAEVAVSSVVLGSSVVDDYA
ncbi:Flagellar hook-length control protein [compost metagenome]